MELILWRHVEAKDGFPDLSRQLTDRGQSQAAKMAAWLRTKIPEDTVVLSSPAMRAQQTAMTLCQNFEIDPALTPGASADQLLAAVNWPYAKGAALVVGHQPTLGDVARRLLPEIPPRLHFKTGTVLWFGYHKNEDTAVIQLCAVMYPEDVEILQQGS